MQAPVVAHHGIVSKHAVGHLHEDHHHFFRDLLPDLGAMP